MYVLIDDIISNQLIKTDENSSYLPSRAIVIPPPFPEDLHDPSSSSPTRLLHLVAFGNEILAIVFAKYLITQNVIISFGLNR